MLRITRRQDAAPAKPRRGRPPADAFARFMAQVERSPDDCWRWRGPLYKGFGRFWLGGRAVSPGRAAWEILRSERLPTAIKLARSCGHEWCCLNPTHASPVDRNSKAVDRPGRDRMRRVSFKKISLSRQRLRGEGTSD
jgi:hypothetical protein